MPQQTFHVANLFGLYSGRQVRQEVDEAMTALAAFLKISGIDIEQGLRDFQAEVDRLDNAVSTDLALIDQLDAQRMATENHLQRAEAAHTRMASANSLIQNVAGKTINLDV